MQARNDKVEKEFTSGREDWSKWNCVNGIFWLQAFMNLGRRSEWEDVLVSNQPASTANRRHNSKRLKDFRCPLCQLTYYTVKGVNQHLRLIHLNEKGYECQKCNYSTSSSNQLQRHDQRVHGKGLTACAFNCESCGFPALSRAGLSAHRRLSHPEEWKSDRLQTSSPSKLSEDRMKDVGQNNSTLQNIPLVLLNRLDIHVM